VLQRGLGARQAGPALLAGGHLQAQTRAVSAALLHARTPARWHRGGQGRQTEAAVMMVSRSALTVRGYTSVEHAAFLTATAMATAATSVA